VKVLAAGGAQHSTAALNDVSHLSPSERHLETLDQPPVSLLEPHHLNAPAQSGAHDGANAGVHARGVAAAAQHGNLADAVPRLFVPGAFAAILPLLLA
jgi:hypothetical protein